MTPPFWKEGFPGGSDGKESACNARDLGSIPVLGISNWISPGEGNSYPLQYSGLENSMDCIVHWVALSWTPSRSEEELKSLLIKVKRELKSWLKTQH